MHFLSLALPAVLCVGVALGQICENGLAGISDKDVCCVLECGQCGGTGCSTIVGFTGDDCCTGNIEAIGPLCSESGAAPCYMGDELPVTPTPEPVAPVVPGAPTAASTCENGLPGIGNKNICCVEGCGQCGGTGCSLVAGYSGDECCTVNIEASGMLCSVTEAAPCIMGADDAPANPTPMPVEVVVPEASETPQPVTDAPYTPEPVTDAPDTPEPVTDAPETPEPVTDAPDTPEPVTDAPYTPEPVETETGPTPTPSFTCSGEAGILKGDTCCEASCGTCGGSGCRFREGGSESCCTNKITEAGVLCSDAGVAPCIVEGYQHLGCYTDMENARIMDTVTTSESMTVSACMEACGDSTYFGVQWGVECWCDGSEYDLHGISTSCDYACPGDDSETCGGFFAMDVYVNV